MPRRWESSYTQSKVHGQGGIYSLRRGKSGKGYRHCVLRVEEVLVLVLVLIAHFTGPDAVVAAASPAAAFFCFCFCLSFFFSYSGKTINKY